MISKMKLVAVATSFAALSACTLEEPGAGPASSSPGPVIARSYEAVTASLSQGAAQCLNGTFRASDMTIGGGMISNNAWTVKLDTSVSRANGATKLTTQRTLLTGAIGAGPNNTGVWVTAVAQPAGSGTSLQVDGRWGSGAIQRAVRSWAQTGRITCPEVE